MGLTFQGIYAQSPIGALNGEFETAVSGLAEVLLTDILGRKVAQISLTVRAGKNTFALPINNLSPGVYILRLDIGNQSVSRKVSVIK